MLATADLVTHFRRQRGWTRELIASIPESHFDWTPSATEFGCGDLVRHLIQAEIFWRRLLLHGLREEAYDPFDLEPPPGQRMEAFRRPNLEASHNAKFGSSFAECLQIWQGIEAETVERLSEIPDAALATLSITHPLTGLRASLGEMFLIMIEHEAHHRGQLSGYLKVIGVPQPPVIGA